ncbi:hypothetical protein [Paenibacillus sp. GCM10028914]|uniref:hypothetical protein n=1 Tax=Paenibacillus sp. GCM10028914 TaxID=3273416 RepID=UPI00360CCB15
MLSELRIASKDQKVSIKATDKKIYVGFPKESVDPARVKIHTEENEVISIPLSEVLHVTQS